MTVALAPPPRRVQKVDMNRFIEFNSNEAILRDLVKRGHDPIHLRDTRRIFASHRPDHGLGDGITDLTAWDDVGVKVNNAKVAKNKAPTLSLTLSSHASCRVSLDGRIHVLNTCSWAGACAAVCVLSHGRGKFPKVAAARNWRTDMLWRYPIRFAGLLRAEILRAARRTNGAPFLARLNVNSDLPWHLIPELFEGVPIQAYDYTKDPSVLDGDGWVIPGKYRKIYSWNETSDVYRVQAFLERGGSIAVVTNRKKGQPVRTNVRWGGLELFPMVDGDQSDNRFDTPPGVIVDLYAKGDARTRTSAFVQDVY